MTRSSAASPIVLLLVLFFCSPAVAVDVPAVFSDHMVLQRGQEVPVWGHASPGAKISVRFAGQKADTFTDADGNWEIRLEPLEASATGREMLIFAGSEQITISDVLVGEVWLCGGQSNMEWVVNNSLNPEEEKANFDIPEIRLIKAPHLLEMEPQYDIPASWSVCSPETVGGYTAIGAFMARQLNAELGVPIGLLSINWGGTRAEPWTAPKTMRRHPRWKGTMEAIDRAMKDWGKLDKAAIDKVHQQRIEGFERSAQSWWKKMLADEPGIAGEWAKPAVDTSEWDSTPVPSSWKNTSADLGGFDGFVWYRRSVDIPPEWAGKELILNLGNIDDADITYFNGQQIGQTTNDWDALRSYMIPGDKVSAGAAVISIACLDTGGAGGIGGNARNFNIAPSDQPKSAISLAGDWSYRKGGPFKGSDRGPSPPAAPKAPSKSASTPGTMFNAMLSPFIPYAIKGAIWYQGESNAGQAQAYRELLPLMIGSWREAWGQGDFPFGIVQLAAFMAASDEPAQGGWANLRDAQLFTHNLVAHTGLVVTTDVGNANDIHPKNKQEVARRMAMWALGSCYGSDDPVSGPIYRSSRVEGGKMILTFDYVGEGLKTRMGRALDGFAIAGDDGNFKWAVAEIVGPDSVAVSHADIAEPKAVRFAWSNNPVRANLISGDGLPASPFKTD